VTLTNVPAGYRLEAVTVGGEAPGAVRIASNTFRLPGNVVAGTATVVIPERKTDIQVFTCDSRKTVYVTFSYHSNEDDGVFDGVVAESWSHPSCKRLVFTNEFAWSDDALTIDLAEGRVASRWSSPRAEPRPRDLEPATTPTSVLSHTREANVPMLDMRNDVQQGSIDGIVTDPSGAVIAGAEVRAVDAATGATHVVRSNDEGVYSTGRLDPGSYTVTLTAAGFAQTRRQVQVADALVRRDWQLTPVGGTPLGPNPFDLPGGPPGRLATDRVPSPLRIELAGVPAGSTPTGAWSVWKDDNLNIGATYTYTPPEHPAPPQTSTSPPHGWFLDRFKYELPRGSFGGDRFTNAVVAPGPQDKGSEGTLTVPPGSFAPPQRGSSRADRFRRFALFRSPRTLRSTAPMRGALSRLLASAPPASPGEARGAIADQLLLYLVDVGRSTGESLKAIAVNRGPRPLVVRLNGLAIEPLDGISEQKLTEELRKAAGGPPTVALVNGYCLNFRKLPPTPGRVYRVAGIDKQRQAGPVPFILEASRRLREANGLHPDSDPREYFHSIRQWAIWTTEQRFDEQSFAAALLEHTKKNVIAAGRQWTKPIETAARGIVPGRWRDVGLVLQEARRLASTGDAAR
jgi:hypothetical protein